MVNFLFQYSKNHNFSNDLTYKSLNHYNYKVKSFSSTNFRIDFLTYKNNKLPKFFENKDYLIFYTGYIFLKDNSIDVKNILQLYLKGNLLKNISSGKFSLFIFDKKSKKVQIINDKFGFVPIFYYFKNYNLIITTEPKGIILSLLTTKFNINYKSIMNYLYSDYILGNDFYLTEIQKLKPGTKVVFKNNKLSIKQYVSIDFDFSKKKYNLKKLKNTFLEGINNYKLLSHNYICDISGGFDSRFIYLLDNDVKNTMTLGESYQEEYKIVQKTLKLKKSNLINIKYKYSNEKTIDDFKKMNYIMDGLISLYSSYQNYLISTEYSNNYNFDFYIEGFLGDGILGGSYLDNFQECFYELGISKTYNPDNYKNIRSFNKKLLNINTINLFNKIDNISSEFDNLNSNFSYRKKIILWKFYNRGLNWLLYGSILRNKQLLGVFPFFQYSFFDEYTKYDLNLLHLKKLYTYLIQYSVDKKYLNLKDNLFKTKLKYKYKLRFISLLFFSILKYLKIYKKTSFVTCTAEINDENNIILKKWILNIILNSKINYLFDLNYIVFLFQKENIDLFKQNYNYILRILNLCLFFDRYFKKINFI